MSPRKFYKTIITVEVLSESPVYFDDLLSVHDAIMDDCSGNVDCGQSVEVDGPTMANLLQDQSSDPGFFGLDDDGNDEGDGP